MKRMPYDLFVTSGHPQRAQNLRSSGCLSVVQSVLQLTDTTSQGQPSHSKAPRGLRRRLRQAQDLA